MDALRSIAATAIAPAPSLDGAQPASPAEGFGQLVGGALDEASRSQNAAEAQVRALAEGRGDVVATMLSLSRAELSLDLVTQVRNRALESYQEIMRLQI
ncbi:MAG TPA: flagellar hook-basal body complex protein FliE [Myxococcota bacterium]|jgi:flagellar hook-basal body complex protein FliE|nr:flagellar hook-basal body complex protein FliE [Myxococcota bacterium]